jgi:hypothetical protein
MLGRLCPAADTSDQPVSIIESNQTLKRNSTTSPNDVSDD